MMASQQSNITSTSTPTSTPELMEPPRCTTAIGKTTSDANTTVSTPALVLTDAVQKCVDTAAEAIATDRQARLIFMQGLVRRIQREAYREYKSSPSAGTPLTQSVFAGIPSTSRGPYPSFITHLNYHNGQFPHYYPLETPNPISQSPTTSAPTTTHSAGMNTSKTSTMTSTTSSTATATSTSSSNTVPTIAREAHRSHTVFAPIDLVEPLTKTNHLLVADMKGKLQSMNNQLSTPSTENLKTRMEALEQGFMELREVVMQRTINNLKPNPELLEVWDPTMMVLQKNNWTNMRLILNKVAEDNYPDLFPSEWDHQKLFTQMHEMHYKVFSEVMTTMFHQCGILMDCNIFEIQNYELFLKALHHHLVMGTVNMTQVGHFLILMTYMSFCRLNHYTDYLSDREENLIEPALWMYLVIISFRSTFQMKETHRTINPYFGVLPTKVRRRLHVIITRYMEQECHCENHVQCDIFPSLLTTEMILPSYQHFIQYLHQKGYTIGGASIPTESGALNKYAETITMIILAGVNGFYSPHFPMSVMEEENKASHNINFSYAETDFFTTKLKQAYPKMDTESLTNAINFLEREKEANCPCSIHTQKRGYDWIVFNRLPDKLSSNTTTTLCSDIEEEDEDVSGAASENYSSADLTTDYNGIFNPRVQNSSNDFSLTSRDGMHIRNKKNDQAKQNQKQMNPTRNDVPFSAPRQKNTDEEEKPTMDMLDEGEQPVDSNKLCKFDPNVTVDNAKGKTYCYKYFRPYKYDWMLLLANDNGESIECTCPRARIHDKKCVWYDSNYINIPDTRNDLSISEQAAQGKIYDMYQNTQNGQQESCGCGTAAEIAYLGHKSTCEEFQWIHERSSYEMLLANLKNRKKVTLFGNFSGTTKQEA